MKQPAQPEQVESVLQFLAGLGMGEEEVARVVRAFPEVVGCPVEPQLQACLRKLEKQWRMSGDVAARAILRKPNLLGYTIDCVGDCVGECQRCWARF